MENDTTKEAMNMERAQRVIADLIEDNNARSSMLTMGGQIALVRDRGKALEEALFEAQRCATIAGLRSRLEFLESVSDGYRKHGFTAALTAIKEF